VQKLDIAALKRAHDEQRALIDDVDPRASTARGALSSGR
jgi:hypothetical protein